MIIGKPKLRHLRFWFLQNGFREVTIPNKRWMVFSAPNSNVFLAVMDIYDLQNNRGAEFLREKT